MIIAIPVDETKENVCVSFGRAPYFMICNESGKAEIFENAAAEVQGGAGIKAAQFVVDKKADILITIRCGENAAAVFNVAGVKMYQAVGINVKQNIEDFKNGKLALLTHFHAGFHGRK